MYASVLTLAHQTLYSPKTLLSLPQEEKELGWGGFDDVAPALKTTVVLKRMFAPEEFEADASLREQLQDDVAVEARKFGAAVQPGAVVLPCHMQAKLSHGLKLCTFKRIPAHPQRVGQDRGIRAAQEAQVSRAIAVQGRWRR